MVSMAKLNRAVSHFPSVLKHMKPNLMAGLPIADNVFYRTITTYKPFDKKHTNDLINPLPPVRPYD